MKKNLIAILIGLTMSVLFGELLFRFIPNNYCCPDSYRGDLDPRLGHWPQKNQNARYRKSCFDIRNILTNSLGLRQNNEILPGKNHYKIAIFGDSYVQGLEVRNEETFSALLQRYLPGVEIINFGVGGYGTVEELVAYIEKGRQCKPDLVVLFFLTGNDIRNNDPALQGRYGGGTLRPWLLKTSGTYEFYYPDNYFKNNKKLILINIHRWLMEHLCIYKTFYANFGIKLRNYQFPAFNNKKPEINSQTFWPQDYKLVDYGVYCKPTHRAWIEAWEITEEAILRFRRAVEEDGAKFLLVIPADSIQVEPDAAAKLRSEYGLKIPDNFDVRYPVTRLRFFAEKSGIAFLSLLPTFLEYRDRFSLPYPYFAYRCDGHWNPLGHFLAANGLAQFLFNERFLAPESLPIDFIKRIGNNLHLPPQQVLGQKAWKEIYAGGIYSGISDIIKY